MDFSKLAGYRIVLGLGLVLGALTHTTPASATSCAPLDAAEHVSQSDVIFYGEMLGEQDSAPDNTDRVVEFKVLRAYKGVTGKTVRITYYNDHGALRGWGFAPGNPTLVFASLASESEVGKDAGTEKPVAVVHYCSMIPYHARAFLHPDYWEILVDLKP